MPTLEKDTPNIDQMIEKNPRVVLLLGGMHQGLVQECREYAQKLSDPDLGAQERQSVERKMQRAADHVQKRLGYPYRAFDDVMQRANDRVEALDKKTSNDSISN